MKEEKTLLNLFVFLNWVRDKMPSELSDIKTCLIIVHLELSKTIIAMFRNFWKWHSAVGTLLNLLAGNNEDTVIFEPFIYLSGHVGVCPVYLIESLVPQNIPSGTVNLLQR